MLVNSLQNYKCDSAHVKTHAWACVKNSPSILTVDSMSTHLLCTDMVPHFLHAAGSSLIRLCWFKGCFKPSLQAHAFHKVLSCTETVIKQQTFICIITTANVKK